MKLLKSVEAFLNTVEDSACTRWRDPSTAKATWKWQRSTGRTCNALGAGLGMFDTPHNFMRGKGVCITPVCERKSVRPWLLQVYTMMHTVMQIIDPEFAEGENYCLQVARSDDARAHQVRRHKESKDISHQYLCALGNFPGATLRQHSELGRKHFDMDTQARFVRMDGRIDHEVVYNDFKGVRFGLVFYKSYDPKIDKPTPKLHRPRYVWPFDKDLDSSSDEE